MVVIEFSLVKATGHLRFRAAEMGCDLEQECPDSVVASQNRDRTWLFSAALSTRQYKIHGSS